MKPNTNKFLLSVLQTYLLASNRNTMPPQDASKETMATPPSKRIKSVVVVRHGERLDYVMRDAGQNWIPTSERPWDPPLTDIGHEQAQALGEALPDLLRGLDLPPIAAIYSSPFYRCRQTAVGLLAATTSSSNEDQPLRVKVELGLAESLNENWYRSWAVPGTDGSWGFQKKELPLAELDIDPLHPASKQPVQAILDWNQQQGGTDESTTISPRMMDQDHRSKTTLDTPYSLHPPKFESMKVQRDRMTQTLHQLSDDHENETIVLVSHGTFVNQENGCLPVSCSRTSRLRRIFYVPVAFESPKVD
jgi:broad specificity phosphatase PhoE